MARHLIKNDYQDCLDVIDLKARTECDFLVLGRELALIRREKKWQAGWDSYEEFLVEMRMSLSTASKIERIWTELVERYQIPVMRLAEAGGWSVVADVLPLIDSKVSAEKYVKMIELHPTRTDLRRTLHEQAAGVDMAKCPHKDVYYLRICRDCGLREEVYPENGQFLAVVDNSACKLNHLGV